MRLKIWDSFAINVIGTGNGWTLLIEFRCRSKFKEPRALNSKALHSIEASRRSVHWFSTETLEMKLNVYLLLERPSFTRYAKLLKASSTAGLEGKCDRVFGCAGTIWIFVASDDPLATRFFLSLDNWLSFIVTFAILSFESRFSAFMCFFMRSKSKFEQLSERSESTSFVWEIFFFFVR